jgi:hypothetical protein
VFWPGLQSPYDLDIAADALAGRFNRSGPREKGITFFVAFSPQQVIAEHLQSEIYFDRTAMKWYP